MSDAGSAHRRRTAARPRRRRLRGPPFQGSQPPRVGRDAWRPRLSRPAGVRAGGAVDHGVDRAGDGRSGDRTDPTRRERNVDLIAMATHGHRFSTIWCAGRPSTACGTWSRFRSCCCARSDPRWPGVTERGRRMTLRTTISTPEGKHRYVRALFATIADRYDFITGSCPYGQDRRWKRRLVQLARDHVVRSRAGPGVWNRRHPVRGAARRPAAGRRSRPDAPDAAARAARARRRAAASRDRRHAGAAFRRGVFDVVTTGYGLRNVPDLASRSARSIACWRPAADCCRSISIGLTNRDRPRRRISPISPWWDRARARAARRSRYLSLHPGVDQRTIRAPRGVARDDGTDEGFSDVRVVPVLCGLMAIHVARKTLALEPRFQRADRTRGVFLADLVRERARA